MYPFQILDTPKSIELVDSEREVDRAVRHLHRWDMLGYDVETYHSIDHNIPAFDPETGARMRVAQFSTPKAKTFVFDLYKVDKKFLYRLFPNPFLCVIQNAKFELKFLMYELGLYDFGPIWDTMIAEKLTARGMVAGKGQILCGLDHIAQRRLDIILPKEGQKYDWYKEDLSDEKIEYAARDSQVVMPIQQSQARDLVAQAQVRVSELEFNAVAPTVFMELSGVKMDADAWMARCNKKQKEIELLERQIWPVLGLQNSLFEDAVEPINLRAKEDVKAAFKRIGVKIPVDKEKKETMSTKLFESQKKDFPVVSQWCDFVKVDKALSSYGPKWINKISPIDGRIHTEIKQIGAETGRMSSPDMLVIPKDDLTRNCFIAEEGWVLVDADYSQCELRILAELSRDPNLLLAFDNDYDLHTYSASLIFQVPMEEVTKEQRGIAKNLNFGIVYGIGVLKFANDANIPQEEAQKIMDYYLKQAYPKMGLWLESKAAAVLGLMYGRTMSGRIRKYIGNLNDKEFKAEVQRNAKNLPIQGTNADITKRAMYLVYREIVTRNLQDKIKMLLVIHDEIILEAVAVPEIVDIAKDLLKRNMLKAEGEFLRRVKCKVDINIMRKWSKEPSREDKQEAHDYVYAKAA